MPLLRTDPELLRGFRAGQPQALERVYWAYVRRVDAHIRGLARSVNAQDLLQSCTVSDLIQEVFIRAFSASARQAYDASRDYGPYLAAITRNRVLDLLRASHREVPTAPHDLPPVEDPSQQLEVQYDPRVVTVLRRYVASLPAELQGVYQQRFVLGCSQLQACDALGLSRRTLRTREEHLRKGLRMALQAQGMLPSSFREPFASSFPWTGAQERS